MSTHAIQNTIVAMAVLLLLAGPGAAQTEKLHSGICNVEVDFSKPAGTIRHLNDVNDGPLCFRGWADLTPFFKEMGIKYVRTNDVDWNFDNALSIPYVFPRFELDPDKPENYDFFQTDWYLKSILSLGIELIYGLSPPPEYPKLPPRHMKPPSDYAKWADVCLHVVKHYNDGWANGYHDNIPYWEIWNEPDGKDYWSGTPEQYFKLYETTARAIKGAYPNVKVGGPALASHLAFLEDFLAYCRDHKVPLDFVSWHIYTAQPSAIYWKAHKVSELLKKYGFPNVENVMDEWCYWPSEGAWAKMPPYSGAMNPWGTEAVSKEIQSVKGAAFDAMVLTLLQDTPVNIANRYSGTTEVTWGIFDVHGVPQKNYYSFKAFSLLMDTPQRVDTGAAEINGMTAIAGLSNDKTKANLLISNFGTACSEYNIELNHLPWNQDITYEKRVVDEAHNLDVVKTETLTGTAATLLEKVEVPSVCLISLRAGEAK